MVALILEQEIEEIAHVGIILDDQHSACALHRFANRLIDFWLSAFYLYGGWTQRERDVDRENRALARLRADAHTVAEQIRQTLYDRQTKSKAAAALARGVVELMVFVED